MLADWYSCELCAIRITHVAGILYIVITRICSAAVKVNVLATRHTSNLVQLVAKMMYYAVKMRCVTVCYDVVQTAILL